MFPQLAREILGPFVKFATSVGTSGTQRFDDSINLESRTDRYSIELRWDRLILISEGMHESFLKSNSTAIEIYSEVLQTISNSAQFTEILNCIIQIYGIKILDAKNSNEIVNAFSDKYLNNDSRLLESPTDISIVIESGSKDLNFNHIEFGPFSLDDIRKRNLMPFSSELEKLKLDEKYGLMLEYSQFQVTKKFDFKIVKESLLTFEKFFANLKL
jgi:hypothetical protein